ncbi:MAG: hypothetical protein LBE84_00320 [Planctomycetota bacterium]|jgi:hypothetical protein|nr:hypothetical protein [Planctomycetota bacterium]
MSGWLGAVTPEGWIGRRYMDGNDVFAEEFDSNGDARVDVWRFYHRGILTSEDRDLSGDGRIDCASRWDPRNRRLLSFGRDGKKRGIYDLEITSDSVRTWEIREDRNLDGIADRVLFIQGPSDFFERLGLDLAVEDSLVDAIPTEYWRELWSDDSFTSIITDYRRYSRGNLVQYGEWDGKAVRWRRVGPDFIPPRIPSAPEREATGSELAVAPAESPVETFPAPEEYGNEVGTVSEPYYAEPYPEPVEDRQSETIQTGRSAMSDRTRYRDLPPGESVARSLPAPMRPPGVGRGEVP